MPGGLLKILWAFAHFSSSRMASRRSIVCTTPTSQSIGKAMSSGCIRMINENVIELRRRARVVLAQGM